MSSCNAITEKQNQRLQKFNSCLFLYSTSLFFPYSHLPTLPSLWSVLGSAMMAWTATMASLILVCSSLSSSMCSRRRIWAASFRVASTDRKASLTVTSQIQNKSIFKTSTHLPCQILKCVCPTLQEHPRTETQINHNFNDLKSKYWFMYIFTSFVWLALAIASGESLSWIRMRLACQFETKACQYQICFILNGATSAMRYKLTILPWA